ncbi:GNAT family N-acetyltransferase [Phanerochaete sordida]|uniref:GNAT family N-acetyltransferase n=1 Tax=Phanerochaete sordida TaxID=48140 RepID=A0A9P3L7W7_9APHY|nr:GNAT family N-acetyltransferase [Phanerochaete sordida]
MSKPASPKPTAPYIRRATLADSPALSYICLATADAGKSAEGNHSCGELPGLMFAEPYVHLLEGFGFVVADPSKGDTEEVVGYCLSTWDTKAFERGMLETWLPPYREKYPLAATRGEETEAEHLRNLTSEDKRYITIIHTYPWPASDVALAFSPAHMHIDILPAYQRQGWGKKLIGEVVRSLRDEKGLDTLWLGLDPRNLEAKKFYARLGFKDMPEAPGAVMGLRFEDWKD